MNEAKSRRGTIPLAQLLRIGIARSRRVMIGRCEVTREPAEQAGSVIAVPFADCARESFHAILSPVISARPVLALTGILFLVACAARPRSSLRTDPAFSYPAIEEVEDEAASGDDVEARDDWRDQLDYEQASHEERLPGLHDAEDPGRDVLGCPVVFSPALRGRWYALGGESYYVDEVGRPKAARTRFPPMADDPRDTNCQRDVGRWGDVEGGEADFDGGHLIAHQLGGWGARLNLVPQVASFNRGNWAQIENALADCVALPDETVELFVNVEYVGPLSIVPDAMAMRIEYVPTGARLEVSFANVERGGTDATAERERAVAWLRALGCQN